MKEIEIPINIIPQLTLSDRGYNYAPVPYNGIFIYAMMVTYRGQEVATLLGAFKLKKFRDTFQPTY